MLFKKEERVAGTLPSKYRTLQKDNVEGPYSMSAAPYGFVKTEVEAEQEQENPFKELIDSPKVEFLPNQDPNFYNKLRAVHKNETNYFHHAVFYFFGLAALFGFMYWIHLYQDTSFVLMVITLICGSLSALSNYIKKSRKNTQQRVYRPPPPPSLPSRNNPAAIFARDPPSKKSEVGASSNFAAAALYRPYVVSDRAHSSLHQSQFSSLSDDQSIDRLAGDALVRLGIPSISFNQYMSNMKNFISKTMLKMVASSLHVDKPLIETMVSVSGYEHCREYVIHRIKALAGTAFLAGHLGNKGEKWNEREWTTDLPSDNQIILHILSSWISYYMAGQRVGQMLFKQKYLYIMREARVESDEDILLCSDDWSKFYILTKYGSQQVERFWANPGHDSLYSALTLLFYIIMKKQNFLLEGADLADNPWYMDKIYSKGRMD